MAVDGFEKDFGYLMPFIKKVSNAAAAMADPAARQQLMQLVAGEEERWTRIRTLLAGTAPPRVSENSSDKSGSDQATAAAEGHQFTVGSLRNRER